MDIRYDEINYSDVMTFMDTVKYGTLSKAAKALNISQPAASKRIASLERQYHLCLFTRNGRGLQLTPAGKAFYEEMLKALDFIDLAFTRAAEIQENPVHVLRIGYDGFFDVPLLYEMIRSFERESDQMRTAVLSDLPSLYNENCVDLLEDNIDIMMAPDAWFAPIENEVASRPIAAFQFAILVPETNPLSRQNSVSLLDLKNQELTVAHPNHESPYLHAVKQLFAKHGLHPTIAHFIRRENLCLNILTSGQIAIASSAFFRRENNRTMQLYQDKIRVYPIEDAFYPVSFVWRKNDSDRTIQRFLRIYDHKMQKEKNRKIIDRCYGA